MLLTGPAFAQSVVAAYVHARAADAAGAADVAAAGYGRALNAAPDDQIVAMRAYRQALMAGDYALAGRAASVLVHAGTAPPDADILNFAVALHSGDRIAAGAALARLKTGPLDFLTPVLEAWLAEDRGADPAPLLEAARSNAIASRYAERHRALLAARRGGRGSAAESDAAFGAARLFIDLAEDIASENILPLSIGLTRAALLLDPSADRARLYLAEALSKSGADALALAELDATDKGAFADAAQAARIEVLHRAGRDAEALADARTRAGRPDATRADAETYGDLLAAQGRFGEAADAYAAALARAGGAGEWKLHLARGAALDRAGRWKEALPALRRAVALAPDDAEALTHLGYAEVLHGDDPARGVALLERARSLAPEDAGVADALAWGYYRRGEVARAVPLLEQAARSDPADARASEHLGDAYWRLGRHYEARYAWKAASVSADADAAKRLAAKLSAGLD